MNNKNPKKFQHPPPPNSKAKKLGPLAAVFLGQDNGQDNG
jgi:hypothetical protein